MRIIKDLAKLAGGLLVVFGLIACMCEAPDLDKQMMLFGSGIAMMAVGTLVVLSAGEEGTEYGRYDY